jgi:CRISPR-associated protein Csm1
MSNQAIPTLMETALGGLLQDIGKFMQRAYGNVRNMEPTVRARESVILPVYKGNYSHKHALWTEAFFQWMEDQGLSFPGKVNLHQVRNMAVFHHKPETFGPLGWLAAEADRLSSGMERKQKDEAVENQIETGGWDKFIKTPLLSPFYPVNLGLGKAPTRFQPLSELIPDERLLPVAEPDTFSYQDHYRRL